MLNDERSSEKDDMIFSYLLENIYIVLKTGAECERRGYQEINSCAPFTSQKLAVDPTHLTEHM